MILYIMVAVLTIALSAFVKNQSTASAYARQQLFAGQTENRNDQTAVFEPCLYRHDFSGFVSGVGMSF